MLYAEVFGYEEEIASLHDKVELGSRGDYDVFDIAVSDSREFISVLLYNNVSSFGLVTSMIMPFVDQDQQPGGPDQRFRFGFQEVQQDKRAG